MNDTIKKIESYLNSHRDILIDSIAHEDHPYVLELLKTKNITGIHGRKDTDFENIMSRLLDIGYDKNHPLVDRFAKEVLALDIWNHHDDFDQEIMAVVAYPFLVRAGYMNEKLVSDFFYKRLSKIEHTIKTKGHDFILTNQTQQKDQANLLFNINPKYEALPSIYDLYAWAFFESEDQEIKRRINDIVIYLVDQRFQMIPDKAYIKSVKRAYKFAAGSVYHAVNIESRKILFATLLSKFKSMKTHPYMKSILEELKDYQGEDGLFNFPKDFLKEKKDQYHLYSGAHMSIGISRKNKAWVKIESNYWMLKILENLV